MYKRFLSMVLAMLLLLPAGLALAGDGPLAQGRWAQALARGLAIRETTTFAWGGLPLLDDATNRMLKSLLKATTLQCSRADGYLKADVLLQDASVLDLILQVQDGVYYESSNLLGGAVLRFTPASFGAFTGRLSARAQGVLPPDLGPLFQAVFQMLSGSEAVAGDAGLLDDWAVEALTETRRQRPKLLIPGLHGAYETVRDITRAEALDLASIYEAWIAEGPQDSGIVLGEAARQMAGTLRDLPAALAQALPIGMPPMELRDVYGADDALVARQIEITLDENTYLYAEWTPDLQGLYLSAALGDFAATALISRNEGAPYQAGSATRQQSRTLAHITLRTSGNPAEVVITRTESSELRAGRESVIIKTDWVLQDEALLGEDAVVTLTAQTTQVTSGETVAETLCRTETVWRVKGLGFDSHDVLTISTRSIVEAANAPVDPAGAATLDLMQLDDVALDAWLVEIAEVYLMQCVHTILGRLPADVAQYLLDHAAF